jgi:hypothetical protein
LYGYFKQKCCFYKNEVQESKTGPVWGLVPVGGGGYNKRVKEDKYGGNVY